MNINPADVCFCLIYKEYLPKRPEFLFTMQGSKKWGNDMKQHLVQAIKKLTGASQLLKSPNGLRFLECFKVDGRNPANQLRLVYSISHYFLRFIHPRWWFWDFSQSTVWRIRMNTFCILVFICASSTDRSGTEFGLRNPRNLKWGWFSSTLLMPNPRMGSSCVLKDVEDLFWSGSWLHGDLNVRKLAATWKLSNLRLRYAKCCFLVFFKTRYFSQDIPTFRIFLPMIAAALEVDFYPCATA